MKKKLKMLAVQLMLLGAAALVLHFVLARYGHVLGIPGSTAGEQASFIDRAVEFFGGEPYEVRSLREKDVAESDPGHQEYYFSLLTDEEKRCYREMLEGIRSFRERFYITLSSEKEVNRVYKALLYDHPEIFWIHNRERVYRTVYEGRDYCQFSPGYTYTEEERREIGQAMEEACQEVLRLISGNMDDYEKVSIIYTWLVDHITYGLSQDDQSIAGAFWKKEAVCAGYAGAMQYLLEQVGIPCIYVEGVSADSGEGHAWNIVILDDEAYYVDVTNADQPDFLLGDAVILEEHKTTLFDYLCPFPDEYETLYIPSDDFVLPDCSLGDKNFYVRNQACFPSYDFHEVYNLCRLRLDNNAAVVRFKFADKEAFEAARPDWVDGEAPQDVARYYMQLHGLSRVDYHCGVLENFYTIYYIF